MKNVAFWQMTDGIRMGMVAEVVPSFDWGWCKAWLVVMSTS